MTAKHPTSALWAVLPGGFMLFGGVLSSMNAGADFPFAFGVGMAGGAVSAVIGYLAGLLFNAFRR
jgi:membrane protein DedA with SNARE-associated domain